jgi:hypothetical protein
MPTNLLILPLIAGYWFIHRTYLFKFRAQQLEGYRLLIESALVGAILLVASRILTFATNFLPNVPPYRSLWYEFAVVPYAGTGLLSMGLALVAAEIGNWLKPMEIALEESVDNSGDELGILLYDAHISEIPIAVTLSNRKFYIGYVLGYPNLDPKQRYVSILPIASGYRESEKLTFQFTTNYAPALDMAQRATEAENHIDVNDFLIVIPIDLIQAANLFHQSVYNSVFAHRTGSV